MSGAPMANWFTRGIRNVSRGIGNALQRAFGGEQPAPTPVGQDRRFPVRPPVVEPTPADYFEEEPAEEEYVEYEDEYEQPYDRDFFPPEEEEPFIPLGGQWGEYGTTEPLYTLYGDGEHAGQSWTMTGPEWLGEAYLSRFELLELYGLDNLDVVEQLMDAGYDYDYISPITGKHISGIWHDWRELYSETA